MEGKLLKGGKLLKHICDETSLFCDDLGVAKLFFIFAKTIGVANSSFLATIQMSLLIFGQKNNNIYDFILAMILIVANRNRGVTTMLAVAYNHFVATILYVVADMWLK